MPRKMRKKMGIFIGLPAPCPPSGHAPDLRQGMLFTPRSLPQVSLLYKSEAHSLHQQ